MESQDQQTDGSLRASGRSFLSRNFQKITGISALVLSALATTGCSEPKTGYCPPDPQSQDELVYIGTARITPQMKFEHQKKCGDIRPLNKFQNCIQTSAQGDEINKSTTFECPKDGTHYRVTLNCEYPAEGHCLEPVYTERIYKDSKWSASSVK